MDEGEIIIDSVELISLQDVTHDLAIESGFESRADWLKVAKHGSGDNVYLVHFHYSSHRKASKQGIGTRFDESC